MNAIVEFLESLAFWWYSTAYGANTEFMCMCVVPSLMNFN